MSRWTTIPCDVPTDILPDMVELINETEDYLGSYFMQTGGNGCGGAWDVNYDLYILTKTYVYLYSMNDCSCNNYTAGSWLNNVEPHVYTYDLYEKEREYNSELPEIP